MKKEKKSKDLGFDIIELDPFRLDEEWVNQPKLYREYAEQLADARKDVEEAKAQLDLVEAELYAELSSNPEKYGLSKTTEASIRNAILQEVDYQEAQQVVIDAKHRVGQLDAVVTAIDHRKRALEKLVDLRLSEYYSEPKDTRSRSAVSDAAEKKVLQKGQYKRKKTS